MTVRAPLSEVLLNDITQPSPATVFIVSDQGSEGNITVSAAQTLLGQITQGPKGDVGYTGSTGTQGPVGFTGSQGIQGFTGSTGTQGPSGFTGSTGTQGPIGFTGSTGTQGRAGWTGSIGFTGSGGFTGSRGFTGSQGPGVPAGGTAGQILSKLTSNDYDTVWINSDAGYANTTTNIAGGRPGQIPIQSNTGTTAFISTGSNGNLLQYSNSTATWVSTSTLLVGYATNSSLLYINALGTAEVTPTRYLTMVTGPNSFTAESVSSSLFYHTNNQLLTVPGVRVVSTTTSNSTLTGALVVSGGVGIAKNLNVGGDLNVAGTINAKQLTIEFSTITYSSTVLDDITTITTTTNATDSISGALVVAGGVGIGKDLHVGGTIYGSFAGGISQASNLAGGTTGQVPFQTGPGATAFAGPGTVGQLLMSSGSSVVGPVFKSTSTIGVGFANNLLKGAPWSLPYQSAANTTAFLALGAANTILTSNGTSFSWVNPSGTTSGFANTATNIKDGTVGQIPFQTAPGSTSFFGPGTAGNVLVSSGAVNTGPVFRSTTTLYVGRAALADNLVESNVGSIPYQSGANVTSFISIGTNGYILTSNGTTATWVAPGGDNFSVTTATNIAGGNSGSIAIQSAPGKTTFIGTGTVGYVLTMASNNTATWQRFNSNVDSANTATNLAGGNAGRIPYQTGVGQTGFTNSGTVGQILISGGLGSPTWISTSSFSVGKANTATNLDGGDIGSIPYQSASGTTSFISIGANGYILTSNGTTATWQAASQSVALATTATNLAGGGAGRIVYQTGVGLTGFSSSGTVGQLLISGGLGAPTWLSTSTLTVGRASIADNLAKGAVGSIPYQSGVDTTSFIPIGANGSVLTSDGTTATWQAASGTIGLATTATNLAGGSGGRIPYQFSAGQTGFTNSGTVGQILISGGLGSPTWASTSTITVGRASIADNVAGGGVGSILYQSGANVTSFISIGTSGYVLTSNGTTATWQAASGLTAGNSTTATNLAGGAAGSMPIQSGAGTTGFIPIGTAGTVLTSNGTTATWQATSGLSANTATNLAGGGAGRIAYQTGVGQTGFTNSGTVGQILISNGLGAPTWATSATITGGGTGGTGVLLVQGDINATKEITAYYSSDERLKENITTIENALEKIRSLKGVMFDWKDSVLEDKGGEDGYFVRKHDTGIIAQEVNKVLPEVVATRNDGFLAVRYEKLAGLIIQAINELADEVDKLKKKIE